MGVQVDLGEPLAVLRSVARQRARTWFPELGAGALTVDVRVLRTRPRSTIVLLRVGGEGLSRSAVAKLRRDAAAGSPGRARPGLAAEPLPAAEQSAVEFASLRRIEGLIGPGAARLHAVRALEHVPSIAGLVMERVSSVPGRTALTTASRLRPAVPRHSRRRRPRELFQGAGEWLRRFHGSTGEYDLVDRPMTEQHLDRLFGEFAAYLGPRVGPAAAELAGRAGAVVPGALLGTFPSAVGHGDFAVRNTFVDDRGRVAVIDPMPRWRTPVWEDLARFTVSARLQGLQVRSMGLAYSAGFLDELEREFLTAYFDGELPGRAAIPAAQLLVLFDKWSALVSSRPRHPGPLLRAVDVGADRYVRREGERLLALVEAGP